MLFIIQIREKEVVRSGKIWNTNHIKRIMLAKKLHKPLCIALAVAALNAKSSAQGFLKADNQRIVNEKGENVLLRGIGLGGWMLQEGYMLRVNKEGQQHLIKAKIESLIGAEKTNE